MKGVKALLNDGTEVISHTNTLNSDEFLKASTIFVLENATDDAKKKIKEIYEKNIKDIKSKAKYSKNSAFIYSTVSHNNMNSIVILEFDKSKIKPELSSIFNKYIPFEKFDEEFKFEKLFTFK